MSCLEGSTVRNAFKIMCMLHVHVYSGLETDNLPNRQVVVISGCPYKSYAIAQTFCKNTHITSVI